MSGASGIITGGAQGETDGNAQGLRDGDLGVIEAARAVCGLIGRAYFGKFAVVGGAALLMHGAIIQTSDVDVGITGESLDAFERAARMDPRFTKYLDGWRYTTSFGFDVGVDFLQIGGGCLHQLNGYCLDDDVPVATLTDLALSKGIAWVDRQENNDFRGLNYAVDGMARKGQNFKGLAEDGRDILDCILVGLDCPKGRRLGRAIRILL